MRQRNKNSFTLKLYREERKKKIEITRNRNDKIGKGEEITLDEKKKRGREVG